MTRLDDMVRALVREEIRRLVRADALAELLDDDELEPELRERADAQLARMRRARRVGGAK